MAKCRNLNVLTVEARWAFRDILDRIELGARPYGIRLDGGPLMTARALQELLPTIGPAPAKPVSVEQLAFPV